MSILITGGAGFIGSHLTERLLRQGRKIIVVDNFNDYYDPRIKRNNIAPALKDPNFVLWEKDICQDLNQVFGDNSITTVIHLAARAGVRPSLEDPLLYNKVNVLGTVNLLEHCRKFNVRKFIFGSSSSVYGTNSRVPFAENDPLENPISPYAVTKIAGENLCRIYHHTYGINITALRFFTVYGPRQRPEMAIHKFVRLICAGKEIPFYGDGQSSRDYTYITDIVDGITACLEKDTGFAIMNLGDSKTITLEQLVSKIEEVLGKKARRNRLAMQPGDVPVTYANIAKAGKILGYQPRIDINEGLVKFAEWYASGR